MVTIENHMVLKLAMPASTTANLIEEYKCRIAEHLKKQLYQRLEAASEEKNWQLLVFLYLMKLLNYRL